MTRDLATEIVKSQAKMVEAWDSPGFHAACRAIGARWRARREQQILDWIRATYTLPSVGIAAHGEPSNFPSMNVVQALEAKILRTRRIEC